MNIDVKTTQGRITVDAFVQQYQSLTVNHSENHSFSFCCRTITDNNRKRVLDFLREVVHHPTFSITEQLCQYNEKDLPYFSYTWGFDHIHPFAFLVAEYQDWDLLHNLPSTVFQHDTDSSTYFFTHPNNSVFEKYISHCSIDAFIKNLPYQTCVELFSTLNQTNTLLRFIKHWTNFTSNSVQGLFHIPLHTEALELLLAKSSFIQWLETNDNIQTLSRGLFLSFEHIKPLLSSSLVDNNLELKEHLFLPIWLKNTHSLTPLTVEEQFCLLEKTFSCWEQRKSVLYKYIMSHKDYFFDNWTVDCTDLNPHEEFFTFFTLEQLKTFYTNPEATLPHSYDYRPFLNHSLFETVRTHIALEEVILSLHLDTEKTTEKRKI